MPDNRPPRMLGQVLPLERILRQLDNAEGARVRRELKESNVQGSVEIYIPDADSDPETGAATARELSKYVEVQRRVEDELEKLRATSVAAMNAVATKDRTNVTATADVFLDGELFLSEVPQTHLLWLEDYLVKWRTDVLEQLPVRSPTRTWTPDPDNPGLSRARPEYRARNLKKTVPLVLHQGNDRHPPQATTAVEETHVGQFETTVLSGAISEARKRELVHRCQKIELAIKDAIQRANRTPVVPEEVEGDAIAGYILG